MEQSQEPRTKPMYIHSQLIFDKGDKNTQYRKDSLFNKWSGKHDHSPHFIPLTQINP